MKAFPRADGKYDSSKKDEQGMDLRDYFAAKAMQGFLSAPDCGWDMSEVAVAAYHMADAMLAARRPSPELDGPGEEDGPWAEGWEQRYVAYRAA